MECAKQTASRLQFSGCTHQQPRAGAGDMSVRFDLGLRIPAGDVSIKATRSDVKHESLKLGTE